MAFILLFGIILAIIELKAISMIQRSHREGSISLRTYRLLGASGLVLGAVSVFVRYRYSDDVMIVGFPFPAAGFERVNGQMLDFVGPLTLPFMLTNFFVWTAFPHCIWVASRIVRHSRAR